MKISYECTLKYRCDHLAGKFVLDPCDGKGIAEVEDKEITDQTKVICNKCHTILHRSSGNFQIVEN